MGTTRYCGETNIHDPGMHIICRARYIALDLKDTLCGHSGWLIIGLVTLEPTIYSGISTVQSTGD